MAILSIGVMATQVSAKFCEQIQACRNTWKQDADRLNIRVFFFCGGIIDTKVDGPDVVHLEGVQDDYLSADTQTVSRTCLHAQ